jgi:beta-glucanase (GH16 family)
VEVSMALSKTNFVQTFEDEFSTFSWNSGSDTSATPNNTADGAWATRYWWGSGDRWLSGNNELQYYADPSTALVKQYSWMNPFSHSTEADGEGDSSALTITGRPSVGTYNGAGYDVTSLTQGQPYVSGLITTEGTFSQQYGYFEMRADIPAGKGLWPAFWMLKQNPHEWPPEIDIMEAIGHETDRYYVNTHSNSPGHGTVIQVPSQPFSGFHTYGVKWEPDKITWYFDGVEVGSRATPSDMHTPMYLLANLAVGGNWPGSPDNTTPFPAEMKIDYIRAYAIPLNLTGTRRSDSLTGGAANDTLKGGAGNDNLNGKGGNDTLIAQGGADTVTGEAGADVFVFELASDSTPRSKDTITDFLSGTDIIDLGLIDANTKVSGDQGFTFIGSNGFSGQAGQLRFASGVLSGDVNGDRAADFEVALTGVSSLQFIQDGHQDIIL